MKLKIFLIALLFFNFLLSYSQSDRQLVGRQDVLGNIKMKESSGQVTISLDSLLEENYYKHLIYNSKTMGISGYRIRIFSDNGQGAKDNQKRIRASFVSLYPTTDAYYRYEGSYYKIYVGDYRTKSEAIQMLNRISKNFPDAFVVEDYIKIED